MSRNGRRRPRRSMRTAYATVGAAEKPADKESKENTYYTTIDRPRLRYFQIHMYTVANPSLSHILDSDADERCKTFITSRRSRLFGQLAAVDQAGWKVGMHACRHRTLAWHDQIVLGRSVLPYMTRAFQGVLASRVFCTLSPFPSPKTSEPKQLETPCLRKVPQSNKNNF